MGKLTEKDKKLLEKFHVRQTQQARLSRIRIARTFKKKAVVTKALEREMRIAAAKKGRNPGDVFAYPHGGSHNKTREYNSAVRSMIYLESNHSPPEASYRGSPWESLSSGERPAHSMHYYHHRSPSGSVGGASSTGGSGVQPGWTNDTLNKHMRDGNFYLAMKLDFIDVLNTTAPNRQFYALALYRTACYARLRGLIKNEEEFSDVVSVLGGLMTGEALLTATQLASEM